MLQHIRLLILDLDYLVFDCTLLKLQALRQGMISLADSIPQNVRLPDGMDIEEGYLDHGFRWLRHLDIGLDEERLEDLQRAYTIHEGRLIESGVGRIHPGIGEFIVQCRQLSVAVALGAEASREYLMAVTDRHQLDAIFQLTLCTEEFGAGSIDEMMTEIMHLAEVNPSETLVLGTRPRFFTAAHDLDIAAVGCGWGIRQHSALGEADYRALTPAQLLPSIQEADRHYAQYL